MELPASSRDGVGAVGASGGVSIRQAGPADAQAIARLSGELGYPADPATMGARLARLAGDASHLLLIASADAEPVGWLHAQETCSIEGGVRVEIAGLVVGAAARRRGAGRALVAHAEGWARARGAPVLVVRSQSARTESHAFYPAIGFTTAKTQIVYRKPLRDGI